MLRRFKSCSGCVRFAIYQDVSNPAQIFDGETPWQWFRLEIRLSAFRRATFCKDNWLSSCRSPSDKKFSIWIGFTETKLTINSSFTEFVIALKKNYISQWINVVISDLNRNFVIVNFSNLKVTEFAKANIF